jgi:hypothetical protein
MRIKLCLTVVLMVFSVTSWSDPRRGCEPILEHLSEVSDTEFIPQSETIFGQDLHYLRVPSRYLRQGILFSAKRLDSQSALFIGIEPNGHTYLLAGGTRYDGNSPTQEQSIRKTKLLSSGIVIRIEDPDGKLTQNIEQYLNKHNEPFAFNCASGTCLITWRANQITIDEKRLRTIFPKVLLERYVDGVVRDGNGNELNLDVFVLGDSSLAGLIEAMEERQKSETFRYTNYLLGATALAALAAAGFGL